MQVISIGKRQNILTICFAKIKLVKSTDCKTRLPGATLMEAEAKILIKVRVLKLKSVNSKTSRSRSFHGSLQLIDDYNLQYDYVMFAERQAKILLEKSLNMKILFYQNKTQVWNIKKCFNVVSEKNPFLNYVSSASFRAFIIMYK